MTIAEVQNRGSGTGNSLAYSSNNTAGNLLVAVLNWGNVVLADVTGVADTNGNTWFRAKATVSASTRNISIWYALNCNAGANTVTATYAAGAQVGNSLRILEYSGANTFDLSVSNTGNSTTSSFTFTPAAAHELCVSTAQGANGALAASTSTGYVSRTTGNNTPFTQDRVDCPAGAQTATNNVAFFCCGCCLPQPWAVMAAVFKNVAAANDAIFYNHT